MNLFRIQSDQPAVARRLERVAAVVNPLSQGVGPAAAGLLAETVSAHGLRLELAFPPPDGLTAAIRRAIDDGPDALVVLAGDGTAREAAQLCGPDGPPLVVLPGGTMNVLAHALNGATPWRPALEAVLAGGVERMVSGGKVGGRPFYCAAVLGSPALWAPVREAMRTMALPAAWRRGRRALENAFAHRLRFEADHAPRQRTVGLGLICPMVSRAMDDGAAALEVALLDHRRITEVLRLGFHHLSGDWRADPRVLTTYCAHGRVWAHRPIPAILDGESFRLERSVEVEFMPQAFRALVPAPAP